ncbi:DUF6702 family protein [Thalassotalea maritima]|uniref:DUF6702 family protein n=1 Tax=Thalassotalea maritima TaxID=3242416 RepID=UPI0035281E3F
MTFRALLLTVCMSLGLMSAASHAHQLKEAFTTVLFNDRTSNIEVSHRFYLHDAEHAMVDILGKNTDLLSDKQSQADFAQYIQQQFRLLDQHKTLLALGEVGFEVEGKFFWVYQEIEQPQGLTSVFVKMRALQDVWPGQVNQINVEYTNSALMEKKVRSVRVTEEDDWQELVIDRAPGND